MSYYVDTDKLEASYLNSVERNYCTRTIQACTIYNYEVSQPTAGSKSQGWPGTVDSAQRKLNKPWDCHIRKQLPPQARPQARSPFDPRLQYSRPRPNRPKADIQPNVTRRAVFLIAT